MVLTAAPDFDITEAGIISNQKKQRFGTWLDDLTANVNGKRRVSELQNVGLTIPINPKTEIIRIEGTNAGDQQITGIQIPPTHDGALLKVVGTNDSKTVTLRDGDGLKLTGGNITLGFGKVLNLHYDAILEVWVENSRN
ncbi:MAG: hypothetical protein ACFFDN_00870 [Candidatus Hodarchaeota archaeon]